jgi:hypothetical protein
MDAFLKVITVNFKMHIAPGIVQDIKGHMYTSLCDIGPVRRAFHGTSMSIACYMSASLAFPSALIT